MLENIWNFNIQIFPIILYIFSFEIVSIIRKYKDSSYVPLYFIFFPLEFINNKMSVYLGDDYQMQSERITEKETKDIKKWIIIYASISLIIYSIITPLLLGTIFSIFTELNIFYTCLVAYAGYKFLHIFRALKNFSNFPFATNISIKFLWVYYILVQGVIFELSRSSHIWAYPFFSTGNYIGLFDSFSKYFFGKFVFTIILIPFLTTLFFNIVLNNKNLNPNATDK